MINSHFWFTTSQANITILITNELPFLMGEMSPILKYFGSTVMHPDLIIFPIFFIILQSPLTHAIPIDFTIFIFMGNAEFLYSFGIILTIFNSSLSFTLIRPIILIDMTHLAHTFLVAIQIFRGFSVCLITFFALRSQAIVPFFIRIELFFSLFLMAFAAKFHSYYPVAYLYIVGFVSAKKQPLRSRSVHSC